MAAGDIDPGTQRLSTDTPAPGGLPADLNAQLTEQFRQEAAATTQGSGWGDPNKTFVGNVLDKARKGVDYVDTLGGRVPSSRKYGGLITPDMLVPQTGGELLSNAAGAIPGFGPGASLLRIATAGAGGYVGNMLSGDNPTGGALRGMAGQTVGEAGGGAAGAIAAHRYRTQLADSRNPQSDSVLIPAAIASEVDAFSHVKTPNDVQQLATQGQTRLSRWYQFSMDAIVRQTGDPMVNVPSVAALSDAMPAGPVAPRLANAPTSTKPGVAAALGIGTGTQAGTPQQMPLSQALRIVQTTGEAAFSGPRTPETVRLRQLWRQAQEEIGASLPSKVQAPNGTTVNIADFYHKAKDQYATGQAIIGALNSRGEGAGPIFTRSGNKVIFNQTAEANGGTPFQRAMFEASTDLHPSATARASVRGGEMGTGDSAGGSFPLWLRSKGLEGIGASIHSAFPKNPLFAGPRQPVQVDPALRTIGGQGAVNSTLNTLLPR